MRIKKIFILFLLSFVLTSSADAEIFKLTSAWMGEHETFIAWNAKQRGWDKEYGFELIMIPFESGKEIVDSLSTFNWDIAGCGIIPTITTPLRDYVNIIAVANDESNSNEIFVREESDVLEAKATVSEYPDIFGSKMSVKNKAILCPRNTSAHYLVLKWLHILGLNEDDVKIKNIDPTKALSSFIGGDGDIVSLWSPLTFLAKKQGFQSVATAAQCGIKQYVLLVANRYVVEESPAKIKAFLAMYMKGIEWLIKTPIDEVAHHYIKFYKEWSGIDLTFEEAINDIESRLVFGLSDQLDLFREDGCFENTLENILEFSIEKKLLKSQEINRMRSSIRISDEFLRELGS